MHPQLVTSIFLLLISFDAFSRNYPCSGNKGGISHCLGSRFVCNDGSFSASKKACDGSLYNNINKQSLKFKKNEKKIKKWTDSNGTVHFSD